MQKGNENITYFHKFLNYRNIINTIWETKKGNDSKEIFFLKK